MLVSRLVYLELATSSLCFRRASRKRDNIRRIFTRGRISESGEKGCIKYANQLLEFKIEITRSIYLQPKTFVIVHPPVVSAKITLLHSLFLNSNHILTKTACIKSWNIEQKYVQNVMFLRLA